MYLKKEISSFGLQTFTNKKQDAGNAKQTKIYGLKFPNKFI